MAPRVRIDEGSQPQPLLLWDSLWKPADGCADWAIADADEAGNRGGLRAKEALNTAVINALFTDRYCPDNHPLRYLADDDQRGWWGNGVDVREDLGEAELGSLLWLFERAPITREIIDRWVPAITLEALKPLLDQKVIVRADIEANANELSSRIDLYVRLYGRDGGRVYDQKFEMVWQQIR